MAAWLLNLDGVSGDTAATPDEIALPDIALDGPQVDLASAVSLDDGVAVDVVQDDPQGDLTINVDATPDDLAVDLAVGDAPGIDQQLGVIPDALGVDVAVDDPTVLINDTGATPDGLAVPVVQDNPIAGEVDATTPADDLVLAVTADNPTAAFAVAATPDGIAVGTVQDNPVGDASMAASPDPAAAGITCDPVTASAAVFPDGIAATAVQDSPTAAFGQALTLPAGPAAAIAQDPPAVGVNIGAAPADGPAVPVTQDAPTLNMGGFITPPDTFSVPITLTAPTFSFAPSNTTATPASLHVPIGPGEPGRAGPATPAVQPIVAPAAYVAPQLPAHLLGIGPWNTAVLWRGAPNHGVAAGRRASVPIINLPQADSMTVNLRLNDASEAKTSHYFPRREAIVIEENLTDLWWRRRDPRRGVVDRIGRFNASTVDMDLQPDGGVNVSATYTDYRGWLGERIITKYLTPGADPPTTLWAKGTLVTDILRWAIPTNMGLDLTGIQAATPDITATITDAFHLPLGTTIAGLMSVLPTISSKSWEWWVEMPANDTDRPRLTLATARGQDRGVVLFDIGGQGPIQTWSVQRSGDKYVNTLMFQGKDGVAIVNYPDQIARFGERDDKFTNEDVSGQKNGSGVPTILKAAAERKLAELASYAPSYEIVLRQGFWEGRTHIDLGDSVGIRLELGDDVIIAKHRVVEIQVEIDAGGFETVTLTLGTARPSRDPRSRTSGPARVVRYLRNYTYLDTYPSYDFTT